MKKLRSIVSILLVSSFAFAIFTACDYKASEPMETSAPDIESEEIFDSEDYVDELDVSMLDTFPEGSVILGTDVSGMSSYDAFLAVSDALMLYTLDVTVNGETISYTAEDLGVGLSVISFNGLLYEVSRNPDAAATLGNDLISYDEDAIIQKVNEFPGITSTAKDAYLVYNKSATKFEIEPEVSGYGIDKEPVIEAIKEAILARESSVELTIEAAEVTPSRTADSDKMQNALSKANALLDLNIVLVFNPVTGSRHDDKLSKSDIGSLIYVKADGITIGVNGDALDKFCANKARQRSVFGESVSFQTTGGQSLNVNATATGELVDTSDIYNDLNNRLSKGLSGTHNVAYYIVRPGDVSGNYGGNYVEVNLTSQHLWCYKGGKLIVSCDIVSGCVAEGHKTPPGVFTIRAKARNTYLVGPTWRSFVNYWMPFNGGIGLHDADGWRHGKYGGDIYLRNGSHGCVNMPKAAAATVYNNMPVGTHVIVYGGVGNTSSPQQITGTTSYIKNVGDPKFMLDARPRYTATLRYSSSNSSVADVDRAGQVTIVGSGTATITVSIDGDSAKLSVKIEVFPAGVTPSPIPTPTEPEISPEISPTGDPDPTGAPDITETPDVTDTPTSEPSQADPTPTDTPTPTPTTPPVTDPSESTEGWTEG